MWKPHWKGTSTKNCEFTVTFDVIPFEYKNGIIALTDWAHCQRQVAFSLKNDHFLNDLASPELSA